jgi:multidrug efflux pump subunit AcrA (membrane-fusion protein)
MKKILVAVVVMAVLGGGYWGLRSQRSLLEEPGKVEAAETGEVTLPITASCAAKEARRVQIKSKASGTIVDIPVSEGDVVKKGDLLIRIDPVDEQKQFNQAELQVKSSEARHRQLALEAERREADVPNQIARAQAAVESARTKYEYAEKEFETIKQLKAEDHEVEREYLRALTNKIDALSQLASAEANLKTAELGPKDVEIAKAQVEVAAAELAATKEARDDAARRLAETEILSPINGRVVAVAASEGLVVGSTITSFSGGIALMELVDTSEVVVEAQVDEADVDRVNELLTLGQSLRDENKQAPDGESYPDEVDVEFDALPDEKFRGQIIDIAQEPKDIANIITYDVRIRLLESAELNRVRLGMQGTVDFKPNSASGLKVPYSSVHRRGANDFVVYVPADAELRLEKEVPVSVGLSDGACVIVTSPELKPGDKVYTKRPTTIGRNDEPE